MANQTIEYAGEIVGAKDTLEGLPRQVPNSKTTLSTSKPLTDVQFVVDISIPAGSTSRTYKWRDMTPDLVWRLFLQARIDKLSGDMALGLTRVFVEVAHATAAETLLQRAVEGGATIEPAERVRLQDEVTALREYEALRDIRGETPEQVLGTAARWREAWVYTESFLLLDGRAGPDLPPLLRQGKRDAYMKSWGVR